MAKTPEERRQYMREWRLKNNERVYQLNLRHAPPPISELSEQQREEVRAKARAYYLKNKDRILAYAKAYKEKKKCRKGENMKKI